MSRSQRIDNSAAVSLFPFLAVLLCTMGALLVVLVAMTRSAREAALREAAAREHPPVVESDPANVEKLAEVEKFMEVLNQARDQAERKLRDEHRRLAHLEDHMRRLREQMQKLQLAAAEIELLEEEHYDDREQAEREISRLQQLIAETRETIELLKEEQKDSNKSYALVPYEGPNGTTRRPMYIECRQGEIILQPEGVRVTVDDLRPPVGPGNPLAAALRAARDHWTKRHSHDSAGREAAPYPLVILRPSGAELFAPAQRAIQTGDFDFGYELVEEEWDLKYPPADPQLAAVEQQAIDDARIRQQALAAAAPRAYRHPALAASGRFEFDGFGGGALGFAEDGGSGDGMGVPTGGFNRDGIGSAYGESGTSTASGSGGGSDGTGHEANSAPGDSTIRGDDAIQAAEGDAGAGGSALAGGEPSREGTAGGAVAGASSGGAGGNQTSPSGTAGLQTSVSVNSPAPDFDPNKLPTDLAATRGADWALQRKRPRAVAVRRSIQVVVRQHQIAVLADDVQFNAHTLAGKRPAGKTIPLNSDTVESIDEFVKVVNEQINGWGMAGDGLYWRPVLTLHVAPDGQRRAQDLARLLKDSGLELQPATAQSNPQGEQSATR